MVLDGGTVRWISAMGTETVRGIYAALRDPVWGTVPAVIDHHDLQVSREAFELRISATCERGGPSPIGFEWTGRISGDRAGTIRFDFDGVATVPFLATRVGLCVLHPLRLAGAPIVVTTSFGRLDGRFPGPVTPYLPFSNITAMRHDVGHPWETDIEFTGDLFETEDQRAFMDASFKTFSRPLAMPQPFALETGEWVRQSVTVRHPLLGPTARSRRRARGPLSVRVGDVADRVAPAIGTVLPPAGVDLSPRVRRAVGDLGLGHMRATLELGSEHAGTALARIVDAGRSMRSPLELVLVGTATDPSIPLVCRALGETDVEVRRCIPVDPRSHATPTALAATVIGAAAAARWQTAVYAGSRGYLYQLLDVGIPDGVVGAGYPLSPQVHVRDDASIIENIAAVASGVETVRSLAPGIALSIGPVSLRPLFDPNDPSPTAPPAPGTLPAPYDHRQPEPIAAAWTVGTVAALANASVGAVTLHEAAGWGGLVAARHRSLPAMPLPSGTTLPVGHAASVLARFAGRPLLEVEADPGLAVLGVADGTLLRILLANLAPTPTRIRLGSARARPLRIKRLVRGSRAWAWQSVPAQAMIEMDPYGLATGDLGAR